MADCRGAASVDADAQSVVINEFMASNQRTLLDQDSDFATPTSRAYSASQIGRVKF